MKRLHVHINVEDLARSIEFYTTLFGEKPAVKKSDYAKWLLDDPRVNFAVSTRCGNRIGVDHLGIQADSSDELTEITARLKAADKGMFKQNEATCCYVVSDKVESADVPRLVEASAENQSDASNCCRP